jgi:phosphatidate cytidylyltransferase
VSGELTRRIVVGVIAAPLAIAILLYGGAPLAGLLAIVSALGAWEFFRIARASGLNPLDDVGIAIAGVIPLVVHARYLRLYDPSGRLGPLSLIVIVLLLLLALAIWMRGVAGKPLGAVAATAFGVAYTGGMLSYGYAIRYHDYASAPAQLSMGGKTYAIAAGGLLLLLPVLVTWASDIGAYAVGRAIGRHKLIPSVSPGKTIEGAVGGLLASMLVALVYTRYVLHPAAHLAFRASPYGVLAFGALVSIAAQVGDLAESLLKREGGVKDSSHLIPGHGGILDRFDSLLFVMPVSFVLLGFMLTWTPT